MRRLLAGMFLIIFAIAFQLIGVATAMPTVMEDLGASHLYAWAFSTQVVGQALTVILAGYATDRIGPATPFMVGAVLFLLGLVMGSVAGSVWVLLPARFVQGLGAGCLSLTLFVSVALVYEGRQRAVVMGAVSFVWLLPAFIGPPVAAWLADHNWRLVFMLVIPVVLVGTALVAPALGAVQERFEPSTQHDTINPPAVVAVALAPAAIQLAGEGLGVWSLVALVVGVVALPLGVRGVFPPAVRGAVHGLGAVVLTRALQAGCFFAAEAFVLLVLKELHGLPKLQAGFALTVGSVGWAVGSWLQSRAWFPLQRHQMITAGAGVCLLGLGSMVVFVAWHLPVWVGMVAWTVGSLGMGVLMTSCSVATMELSTLQEQGRNNSALQVAESLGNAVLTGTGGALLAVVTRHATRSDAFVVVFGVLALASLAALVVSTRIGPVTGPQRAR